MQFRTLHQIQRGSEQVARQAGPHGYFFAFDYELRPDPAIECVRAAIDPEIVRSAAWDAISAAVTEWLRSNRVN